jgi:hypothetical protein
VDEITMPKCCIRERVRGKSVGIIYALCNVTPVVREVVCVRYDQERKMERSCLSGAKRYMVFDAEDEALSRLADW